MSDSATPSETARDWAGLLLLVAAISLPFLSKAVHVDDAFFLRITENILADPLDPFSGNIDWGGVRRPVWELASNPPLLSYYLAPFFALSGGSGLMLHAAMLPFPLLLAVATRALARRFDVSPWLATLFVMTSSGVVVSLNLMRDVPATALGVAAVALVISGTDRSKPSLSWLGFLLAGLALLTRFNAIVFVAVAALYTLRTGRLRDLLPALVPISLLLLWSLHNQLVYGEPQLLAQLGRGHNRPLHAWRDNLAAMLLLVGSVLYLGPALLLRAWQLCDRAALLALLLVSLGLCAALQVHFRGAADAQYLLWSLLGAAACVLAAFEVVRPAQAGAAACDSYFLGAWLAGQLLIGVLVAPYPAVRHLIPALVPLTLLGLRYWQRQTADDSVWVRAFPAALVALQAVVALMVATADMQLAASYRDFALRASAAESRGSGRLWFVGHWGWMYYAERAGLLQLHVGGPGPAAGDRLIVPVQVDKGVALERRPKLRRRLRKLGQREYPSSLPLRTVHGAGAGFYALFSGRNTGRTPAVPYRWLPGSALEVFEIYEVESEAEP